MEYYNLHEGPPDLFSSTPQFKAVLILERSSISSFQTLLSRWLCDNGCRYAMVWGVECSSWDDSIDHENLKQFDFGEIPEDHFVMTTWHEDESIEDVLAFAKHSAQHPSLVLDRLVVLHVGESDLREKLSDLYAVA